MKPFAVEVKRNRLPLALSTSTQTTSGSTIQRSPIQRLGWVRELQSQTDLQATKRFETPSAALARSDLDPFESTPARPPLRILPDLTAVPTIPDEPDATLEPMSA